MYTRGHKSSHLPDSLSLRFAFSLSPKSSYLSIYQLSSTEEFPAYQRTQDRENAAGVSAVCYLTACQDYTFFRRLLLWRARKAEALLQSLLCILQFQVVVFRGMDYCSAGLIAPKMFLRILITILFTLYILSFSILFILLQSLFRLFYLNSSNLKS